MISYFGGDELNGFVATMVIPVSPFPEHLHSKQFCGIVWCYVGNSDKAEEVFKPIVAKKPFFEHLAPLPYPSVQTLFDGLMPPGIQWYWRADFFTEIGPEVRAQHLKFGSQIPTSLSQMHMYPISGAASRVGRDETLWACSQKTGMLQRSTVIPNAMGKVLEIGIGSGLNLSFYDEARVTELTAIDPLDRLWNMNKTDLDTLPFKVNFIQGMANQIPFKADPFDTVVTTLTLCSVEKVDQVLQELHRVLIPEGKLIFAEHGQAPDKGLLWWQNRLNPVWKHIGGGCLFRKTGVNTKSEHLQAS